MTILDASQALQASLHPSATSERDALLARANQAIIEAVLAAGGRAARAQAAYLEASQSALQAMAAALSPKSLEIASRPPALFSRKDLEEFATGSIARCFGPEYQVFESRRYPRIPNGDLLLMDRVIQITGQRHHLTKGATIATEFDVSPDAWFYRDNGYAQLPPYAVLMEMALQPCGLLSAYLGSSFLLKDVDLFFRNLDGNAQLLASPDLRGRTVAAQAELLSSTLSGTTLIQKYRFSLASAGQTFFTGESVFGYFSAAGMLNQVGLDAGKSTAQPPYPLAPLPADATHIRLERSKGGPLGLLDEAILLPQAGKNGLGQVVARQQIDPRDWFYRCHFYQDAVMPGSLGVEAALQAMALFARQTGQLTFPVGKPFTWKYRGQVLPSQGEMSLLVEILSRETRPNQDILTANASVWVDRTRIYELTGLALTLGRPE